MLIIVPSAAPVKVRNAPHEGACRRTGYEGASLRAIAAASFGA